MTDIGKQNTLPDRSVPIKSTAVEDTQALSSQNSSSTEYEELAVVILVSAREFSSCRKVKEHILFQIKEAIETTVVIVDDLKPSWGREIFGSLKDHRTRSTWNTVTKELTIKIMPSWIHDCIQRWLSESILRMSASGLMTDMEREQIGIFVGTTLEFQSGPYVNSRKEPDLFVIPELALENLPSLAIEVGWSQPLKKLKEDVNLLLTGGDGSINVVLVVKWSKHTLSKRVHGFTDVYVRDVFGMPALRQHEIIFPAPLVPSVPVLDLPVLVVPAPVMPTGPTPQMTTRSSTRPPAPLPAAHPRPPAPSPPLPTGGPQRLIFSHEEVFGPTFTPDPARNGPPPAKFDLDINLLRRSASKALQRMNVREAV